MYGCACQEEHFDLIFSLNDTTGAGHIKVAELAQFMESLGHGLPAHQLEEMIKDMGMDEDIDRTIFLDGFLPELSEATLTLTLILTLTLTLTLILNLTLTLTLTLPGWDPLAH